MLDTTTLFDDTVTGIGHALDATRTHGTDLAGIAVDSWGVDYGLVDDNINLTAPARHHRAAKQEFVTLAQTLISRNESYKRTGIVDLAINTCFQLLRDAQDGLLTPGVKALLMPDLWTAWLGGVCGAEQTIASTTGLLNWATLQWDTELMDSWSIPRDVLFDLESAGVTAGVLTPDLSSRLGVDYDVQIFRAPAHDTASAFAAVTDPHDRVAVISCGTWALAGCVLPSRS